MSKEWCYICSRDHNLRTTILREALLGRTLDYGACFPLLLWGILTVHQACSLGRAWGGCIGIQRSGLTAFRSWTRENRSGQTKFAHLPVSAHICFALYYVNIYKYLCSCNRAVLTYLFWAYTISFSQELCFCSYLLSLALLVSPSLLDQSHQLQWTNTVHLKKEVPLIFPFP